MNVSCFSYDVGVRAEAPSSVLRRRGECAFPETHSAVCIIDRKEEEKSTHASFCVHADGAYHQKSCVFSSVQVQKPVCALPVCRLFSQ